MEAGLQAARRAPPPRGARPLSDAEVLAVLSVVVATAVGATIQGAIGFGMNLVTVPAMALVVPEALPVAAIALGVPISIGMLAHERSALDRTGVAWLFVGRVPGTLVGTWVVAAVSTGVLQGVVGVVVLLLVAASLWFPPVPVRPSTQAAAGLVSGVTGTAAGIGGPPVALLYQRHAGPTMRSTLAASFLFGTLLSLTTLAVAGEAGADDLAMGFGLAPVVLAGSVAGRRFHQALDRGWLRPAVLGFAALTAGATVLDALT